MQLSLDAPPLDFLWQFNRRKILKLFGHKCPYSTQDPTTGEVDFFGVVAFEVAHADIVGMEYSNMLIENSSRFVLEGKSIKKLSFNTLREFLTYYELPSEPTGDYYKPYLSNSNDVLELKRVFPFDSSHS